jgi:hypothetical protein
MKINGVEVPYWSPTFCEEGADGLVGAGERILTLPYQTVDGVQVDYWSADTCGDKYSYDFGGGSPTIPTSGLVGYYTPFDVSYLGFSSANNVNLVVDQSTASNDLTQGTASANMTLEEHDTVTQFTSANQPTLVDTGGGELAMGFDDDFMEKSISLSGDWAIELDLIIQNTSVNYYTSRASLGNPLIIRGSGDVIRLYADDNSFLSLGSDTTTGDVKLLVKVESNLATCSVNGVTIGTPQDATGKVYNFGSLGRNAAADFSLRSFKQWNSADSSGTPNFELLPTVDSCNVLAGQQVSRWNATSHRAFKNRLLSDGSNDNYDGLPTQAGDFTYVFKCEFDALSTTDYLLSDTGDSAWVLLSDNLLYLRDTTGANDIALTGHTVEAGDHVYIISREGDDLKYYVDSCLKQTVDVTGRTFTFSRVGATADSLKALNAEWGVWNRAFTQDDVDYFSYLRSDDTNAILQPPLTPAP